MILGVGTDLTDITRIEKSLARFGDRFVDRVFTEMEKQKCFRRVHPAAAFAKAFAAKEACAKALGTGFRQGVFWRDLATGNLPSGQPTLTLTGGAAAHLAEMVPAGMVPRIDLSLSDEYPLAQAVVVISAISGTMA
ncbi:holo-ACP synthase [Magnetospira thiophila]